MPRDVFATFDQFASVFKLPHLYRDGDFGVRRWAAESRSKLFLVNTPAQRPYYERLYNLLIELAAAEVMSLPDDVHRRIYFLIDEFQAFHPARTVELLKRGRSKGAAVVLSGQEYNLGDPFWRSQEQAVFNNTRTKVLFGLADERTARKAAECFGRVQYLEERTTVSARSEPQASVSCALSTDYVVMPSEILALGPFEAILGTSGCGVRRIRVTRRPRPIVAPLSVPLSGSTLLARQRELARDLGDPIVRR